MNNFYVFTNSLKDPGAVFTREVCEFIRSRGRTCRSDLIDPRESNGDDSVIPEDTDCVIVIGGDGTVLQAADDIMDRRIPILAINLGTLGYLAQIERRDWKCALERVFDGDYDLEERMMLEASEGNGTTHYALNDVVFIRNGPLRTLSYDVYVGGKFLNSFTADGIIIATPTGSTAYNLSAGGPIVEPTADMILLTPICPHTLVSRSVVLSAQDEIGIRIGRTGKDPHINAQVDFDGRDHVLLSTGEEMQVRRSKRVMVLVRLGDRSFLETLRKKMQE